MNAPKSSDPLAKLHKLALQRFGTLRPAEIKMFKAALQGEVADCDPNSKADDPLNASPSAFQWSSDREIRADLLRWLCLDQHAGELVDPWGIGIDGALISGSLNLAFSSVRFPIRLKRCWFLRSLVLYDVRLGYFDLSGSTVPSVEADGLRAGSVRFSDGFMSTGTVSLRGCQIEGDFSCDGGTMAAPYQETGSDGDTALDLTGARIQGDVFLSDFKFVGAVALMGTHISGDLDFSKSVLGGTRSALALNADRAIVEGSLFLSDGFAAKGEVRLFGTKIVGEFDCRKGKFGTVNAQGMSVGRSLFWCEVKESKAVTLKLRDASVNSLVDDVSSWPENGGLVVDGFSYGRISDGPTEHKERLQWLSRQKFATQPYQQLARVLREEGDDRGARRVLYEMERLRRRDGKHGPLFRAWSQLFRWTIGYGLFPRRALWTLLFVVLLGWGLYRTGYGQNVMVPTNKDAYSDLHAGKPIPHYQHFYALVYSLENSFPLVNLGQKEFWTPDPNQETGLALSLRIFRWLQVISGWVLATFFAAGVTGIARKD